MLSCIAIVVSNPAFGATRAPNAIRLGHMKFFPFNIISNVAEEGRRSGQCSAKRGLFSVGFFLLNCFSLHFLRNNSFECRLENSR